MPVKMLVFHSTCPPAPPTFWRRTHLRWSPDVGIPPTTPTDPSVHKRRQIRNPTPTRRSGRPKDSRLPGVQSSEFQGDTQGEFHHPLKSPRHVSSGTTSELLGYLRRVVREGSFRCTMGEGRVTRGSTTYQTEKGLDFVSTSRVWTPQSRGGWGGVERLGRKGGRNKFRMGASVMYHPLTSLCRNTTSGSPSQKNSHLVLDLIRLGLPTKQMFRTTNGQTAPEGPSCKTHSNSDTGHGVDLKS